MNCKRFSLISLLLLQACVLAPPLETEPPIVIEKSAIEELSALKPPGNDAIFIGVYDFTDKTGQRTSSEISDMSSAVPQGLASMLVQELERAGNGTYFRVVERESIDALLGERRIAEVMLGEGGADQLGAMFIPGIYLTGGAVSYDRNVTQTVQGLGVASVNGRDEIVADQVGVILRAVSVKTGEVLATVMTSKSVISRQRGMYVLSIISEKVGAFEVGGSTNEPVSYATRLAIAAAVIELTKQGKADGWWKP